MNIFCREHKKSMIDLRDLLNKRSIIRRNRRVLLNIQITILAWSLEMVGSIIGAMMFWMPIENGTSRCIQMATGLMYFVMIPSVYLINSTDKKSKIMDSKIYLAFTEMFFSRSIHHNDAPVKKNDLIRNAKLEERVDRKRYPIWVRNGLIANN